jgi:hypothetical protein
MGAVFWYLSAILFLALLVGTGAWMVARWGSPIHETMRRPARVAVRSLHLRTPFTRRR